MKAWMSSNFGKFETELQSSRKRLIGRIFTHTFAVLRQINPGLDSPLRLFFIVTTVIIMTTDQYSE